MKGRRQALRIVEVIAAVLLASAAVDYLINGAGFIDRFGIIFIGLFFVTACFFAFLRFSRE